MHSPPGCVEHAVGAGPEPWNCPHEDRVGAAEDGEGSATSIVMPLPAATSPPAAMTTTSFRMRALLDDLRQP
ncbi:hypothetical protein GTV32_18195 [Gordonia sp. SID5947]|uniref:hypothetical protein n=1 Tax=Gordonia sp. SID5947 TaxID=2690315 RepID=UPI00137067DD|nr:hypothetical protein [Gordonia sp. SID5947]MYR08110.1 hypothetical protein [Gordonia sp. SID5947]